MSKTLFLLFAVAACGGAGSGSRFPSRPDGCDVHVFQTAPPMQTENIGPVSSHCDDHDFTQADCLRTLKDQVCKLGGDVVWGVPAQPDDTDGQWRYTGRAAHTK